MSLDVRSEVEQLASVLLDDVERIAMHRESTGTMNPAMVVYPMGDDDDQPLRELRGRFGG